MLDLGIDQRDISLSMTRDGQQKDATRHLVVANHLDTVRSAITDNQVLIQIGPEKGSNLSLELKKTIKYF